MDVAEILEHLELDFKDDGNEEILVLCPFHSETKPSLQVNRIKLQFHCFGCGEGGSIYKLAQLLGKSIPSLSGEFSFSKSEKKKDQIPVKVPEKCVPISQLKPTHPAKIFLIQKRGFKIGTLKTFGVLYNPEDGALIFPGYSDKKEQVTYQRRLFRKDDQWLNPENGYISTHLVFFGLQRIKHWEKIVLTEGPFDVMRLYEWNYQALGLFGSDLSGTQANILKKFSPNRVFWCLDGDEAGRKGVAKGAKLLYDVSPRIAQYYIELPNGKDPDSMKDEGGVSVFSWRAGLARRIRI